MTHMFHVDVVDNEERLRLTYATASPPPYALDGGRLSYQHDGDPPNLRIFEKHLYYGLTLLASGDWWYLSDGGTLYVRCVGDMPDYEWGDAPWYNWTYLDAITDVIISDSVTGIGNCAFANLYNMASVIIPDSVTSIGDSAFHSCNYLTSVIIPDSVTYLGESAFDGCSALTAVTIPDSVTYLGERAFFNCPGLTSITIPGSVGRVRPYTFSVSDSFTYTGLINVVLSQGVTAVDHDAFAFSIHLSTVTFPVSLTRIGGNAFDYGQYDMQVYYAGTEAQWNAVQIGANNDAITGDEYQIYTPTIHYNSAGPN